jgi:hypothetical protein
MPAVVNRSYCAQGDHEIVELLSMQLKSQYSIEYEYKVEATCPSCLGVLQSSNIELFEREVFMHVARPSADTVAIQITVEPMYDLVRVVTRAVTTGRNLKSFPFANACTVFERAFVDRLQGSLRLVPQEEAQILVGTVVSDICPNDEF